MNLPSRDGDNPSASSTLRQLAAGAADSVPFGAVAAAAGSRVHGFALLLLVLPETLPLPLPSASGFLAIPLILVSAHLAVFGEGSGWPARLQQLRIPRKLIAFTARYVAPPLEWFERRSQPQWGGLVRRERLIGLVCLYLSVILLMPLPFVNAPPAICVAAISLGLIQRDGVFIAIGMAGAAILTAVLAWVAFAAGAFFIPSA